MAKNDEVKVVEFDANQSRTQQDALIDKLRKQGWAVRSVELGPDRRKRVHLVKAKSVPGEKTEP